MFGATGVKLEEKLEKMVKKGDWEKLKKKYLNSNAEDQLALAKSCKFSTNDESCNLLIALLDSPERNVVLEALNSIKLAGNDHAVTTLQLMQGKVEASDTQLKTAYQDALTALRSKK